MTRIIAIQDLMTYIVNCIADTIFPFTIFLALLSSFLSLLNSFCRFTGLESTLIFPSFKRGIFDVCCSFAYLESALLFGLFKLDTSVTSSSLSIVIIARLTGGPLEEPSYL